MTTADRARLHRLAILTFIFLAVLVVIQAGGMLVMAQPDFEPFRHTITLTPQDRFQ